MSALSYGLIAGLSYGIISVLIMLPMKFENAYQAYLASFFSRFSIGFLVPLIILPMPMWAIGAIVGFLISLSDAIITKTYAPILLLGTIGGAIIGYIGSLLII